jgi:hypothetical protein
LIESAGSANARLILGDPQTISWVDAAGRLVRAHEDNLSACEDWRSHLRQINFIALAAAVLSKSRFAFQIRFAPNEVKWIPAIGSNFRNTTDKPTDVQIQVDPEGAIRLDESYVKILPNIQIAGHEFSFRDGRISMPTLAGHVHISQSEFDSVAWQQVLEGARILTRVNARWDDLVTLFGKTLGPLQPSNNYHLSVSFRMLPKAIFLASSEDPLVIAEVLVHESDHNMLYAIDRRLSLWKPGNAAYEPIHWSPWRNDLRPLDGNLRGASAFTSVSEFLLDVFLHAECGKQAKEAALQRAVLAAVQVREALTVLFEAGAECITADGKVFLAQLSARLEGVFRRLPSTLQVRSFEELAISEVSLRKSKRSSSPPNAVTA